MQGSRQRLCTLEENEEEDDADGAADQGRQQSSEQQQADQCAADLLRTNSLITLGALDAGKRSPLAASAVAWLCTAPCFTSGVKKMDKVEPQGYLKRMHAYTCTVDVSVAAVINVESFSPHHAPKSASSHLTCM